MSDAPIDGLAALNDRVERAKRSVPPPRRPRAVSVTVSRTATGNESRGNPSSGSRRTSQLKRERPVMGGEQAPTSRAQEELVQALPDAPTVMLGARVRVPLDDLLNDLVHEARHHQVRTSKVELVELALLSLAGVDPAVVAERVREFRSQTGRYLVRR